MGEPGLTVDTSVHEGAASHITNLIKSFRKIDIDVIPILAGGNRSEQKAKKRFVSLKHRLPEAVSVILRDLYKTFYNFKFYWQYKLLFKQKTPDFIYERWSALHFMTAFLAKRMRIPYILEVNAPPVDIKWFTRSYFLFIITFLQKKVAERADAIVVVSRKIREYFIHQGIESEKIFVISNAADINLFVPDGCNRNIRLEYGIPVDSTLVGFVGSMRKYHGLEVFLEAAAEVVKINRATRFLLVGSFENGNKFSDFLNILDLKGIKESFILTGKIPFSSVPEYLSAMDICVMPDSNQYGSPIKIFEYGAMGKPTIAPRVGPVEEIIDDGENGILINPGDAEDLKQKILYLIDNPELQKKLGSNLKRKVHAKYTWDKNAQKVLQIYRGMRKRQH